ncbi:unnamed protein product, partial [Meganyctiphanes norvegica]
LSDFPGQAFSPLFVGVSSLVNSEGSGLAEALVTDTTLEGLVLAMDVLMVTKMILPPEGLATDVTGEGPLICVCPLVDHEVVALGELPVAVLADVALLGAAEAASCG